MAQETNIVVDQGQSKLSDLWTKEDYLAIWLGFLVIVVCIGAYFYGGSKDEISQKMAPLNQIQAAEKERAPFKTVAWHKAQDDKAKLRGSSTAFGKFAGHWTKKPGSWKTNPLDSLVRTEAQAKALNEKAMPKYEAAKAKAAESLAAAEAAETAAAAAAFQDQALSAMPTPKKAARKRKRTIKDGI